MESGNMPPGGDGIDWNDPAFNTTQYQDNFNADSPWGNSALNDFTNLADYGDTPAVFNLRTPSKSEATPGAQQNAQGMPAASTTSADSSSQDDSSESSSHQKLKVTESPLSDPTDMGHKAPAVKEEAAMDVDFQGMSSFDQTLNQPMPRLAVNQNMPDDSDGMFDFNSAASSPALHRDFNQQMSLNANMNAPRPNTQAQFAQESPMNTINPGMFSLGGSRDQSPQTTNMFNTTSPNAIFSTPSSDSNETFTANQNWNGNVSHNSAWSGDFGNQFTPPDGLAFTPSPVVGAPVAASGGHTVARAGRSGLHIAPMSAKSRVETQINVVMTLEQPPPNIEYLHLPLHTIAKSKLLAKDEHEIARTLELHTMLVCASAMHEPANLEKALKRAAEQNNEDVQRKAEDARELSDEEKNDTRNLDEEDKPAHGGEVKICANCIQRERKRAGRKKLKREEEQQHWEKFETERVVVFNSNEFLPFKPFEHSQQPQKDGGMGMEEPYNPPEGALSVSAAMRVACYCRHQSEKEGFQVIFTLKDQQGNVVAQEMSDSILITDDHKTHPPQVAPMPNEFYMRQATQFGPNGLPTSYSMMDLSSHSQPFTSSRSTGNLQAMAYGDQQFNPHSHVHQLPTQQGFMSQATSATMTPTNLSRPASPTSAGQTGPNKKRKSSSFHRKVPSGLQMTPRVDTSQPPSSGMPSSISMPSQFSPTGPGYTPQNDQSYMTIPNNNGPAQYYGSGPPTPGQEHNQFSFGAQPHQLNIARAQNASAYFSHPSSAVPSRSSSPVLQQRGPNMAAYMQQQRAPPPQQQQSHHQPNPSLTRQSQLYPQHPSQTHLPQQNHLQQHPQHHQLPQHQQQPQAHGIPTAPPSNTSAPDLTDPASTPTITKINPPSGPLAGGTEVSLYGYNFTPGTRVAFGDTLAATTFYGAQSILAIAPPGRAPGAVRVSLVSAVGSGGVGAGGMGVGAGAGGQQVVFSYTEGNPRMMEMALRFLAAQQLGDAGRWAQYANEVAAQFMKTSISPAGIRATQVQGQGQVQGAPGPGQGASGVGGGGQQGM